MPGTAAASRSDQRVGQGVTPGSGRCAPGSAISRRRPSVVDERRQPQPHRKTTKVSAAMTRIGRITSQARVRRAAARARSADTPLATKTPPAVSHVAADTYSGSCWACPA